MFNVPKLQGVIARKKNPVWCKKYSVRCSPLGDTDPIVIDGKNLAHLAFSAIHLCLHERNQTTHLRASVDAEVSNYIVNQTSISTIYRTLDLHAVEETFQHIFRRLKIGGRRVIICLDSCDTECMGTQLSTPNPKELQDRQKLRAQYVGSGFKQRRRFPNRKATRFLHGPDVNCPVLPRPITRILIYTALKEKCEVYMIPGEADAVVALYANHLNGVAISDDGDVFNFANKTFLASECVQQLGPEWLLLGLKRYYNRYPRCTHCCGCYIHRNAMLKAIQKDSKDDVTVETINRLLDLDTTSLESEKLLESTTRIQCIVDYDKHISSTRFHSLSSGRNNSISCGIRWDPPNSDGSNHNDESIMVITRILRWPFLERNIEPSNTKGLKEIIRYRLGDTERTVTEIKFDDIPMAIRKSVHNNDFESFFTYVFPGVDSSGFNVYDVATKLSRLWFHKQSLAQVALQHEFVHELLCAFPDRFMIDIHKLETGYESFIPK